jgi:3',5'-cyclic AMP phosphodiesterase CpdA
LKVQIVHISDLHFKNDVENRVRLQNLLTDLKVFERDQKRYVAFTGDLVHSGDDNNYGILFDLLISPLVSSGAEVFVVPGNHDVQRSLGDEERCDELLVFPT